MFDENTGELLPRDPAYPGWHDYAIVDGVCASPTQSTLQTWIRDVHGIDIVISTHSMVKNVRGYSLYYGRFIDDDYYPMLAFDIDDRFDKYEKALEVGLQLSLTLIK